MLVLDDEQVDELALTGQTGELSLDDIATMSVKELRAALREERQERAADKQVSAKKTERIDALERKLVNIERQSPDEQLVHLKKEATSIATETEAMVLGSLRQALIAMNNHGAERGRHDVFMAGLVGQVQAQLNALRAEFNLPDVSNAADAALAAEVAQWAQ
jgi:ribosomal protein L9